MVADNLPDLDGDPNLNPVGMGLVLQVRSPEFQVDAVVVEHFVVEVEIEVRPLAIGDCALGTHRDAPRIDEESAPTPVSHGVRALSAAGTTERAGFEPAARFNPCDGLANRSFRPLRHLSRALNCA